jgi:CRP-like cAMP-binding protein
MLCRTEVPAEDILSNLPLFNGLDREALKCIKSEFAELDLPRGTTLFRPGDPCSGIYVVVSGQVKVSLCTAHGAEKVVELAGPGQTLGETAVFLDRPHKTSAETLLDCRLLHISTDKVFGAVESHPRFAQRIIVGLSHRLDCFISDLESLTLHNGTERVVGYLLSRLGGELDRRQVMVTLPASKGVIASRLNLTQEHFSRILRDLAVIDLIRVDGRAITIRDVDQLRARTA